ncbi:MAG: hypothetical protein AAFW97_14530 [Pseudomonadota bacterium]
MTLTTALKECIQKPDSYPAAHIILHAVAVVLPVVLSLLHPLAPGISVACWGIVILAIGGHGERALGGNFGAVAISLGLGAVTAAAVTLGPWPLWACVSAVVAALAWLTEYHQNGGHWCGEDKAGLVNRLKGSALGAIVSLAVPIGLIS